jgi:DNA-binding MarR family transcriptional regulator
MVCLVGTCVFFVTDEADEHVSEHFLRGDDKRRSCTLMLIVEALRALSNLHEIRRGDGNTAGPSKRSPCHPAAPTLEEERLVPPVSSGKALKKVQPPMPAVDESKIDFETIELFFFAYRDFISDPDAILEKIGMGRAHHRVVYFVCRQPGMMVTDLLDTLQITKQSLARVLKQLIDSGYIRQMAGAKDRRQRRLYPTLAGRELALALSEPQSSRICSALSALTPEQRDGVIHFLRSMRGRAEGLTPVENEVD